MEPFTDDKERTRSYKKSFPLSPCCHHLYSLSTLLAAGPSEHFITSSPAHFTPVAVTGQMSAVLAQQLPSFPGYVKFFSSSFFSSVFLAFWPFVIRLRKVNCCYSHHQVHQSRHMTMASGLFPKAPYRSVPQHLLLTHSTYSTIQRLLKFFSVFLSLALLQKKHLGHEK